MTLGNWARSVEKFSADNSPAILTAIGVAGTLTTAVLSAKAGVQSHQIMESEREERKHGSQLAAWDNIPKKDVVQLTWKVWVLPASVGTITVTSIIMANRIGTRRAAAMATAYMVTSEAFDEYKHKVVEKLGETKERAARDEIAQDRVNRNPDSSLVIVGNGEVLCYDQYSGRYFNSTVENIKKAINDTNHRILSDNNASLSDFYQRIGLSPTSHSEDVGWNSEKLLDILFSTVLSEDGRPCVSIDFAVQPIRKYYKFL